MKSQWYYFIPRNGSDEVVLFLGSIQPILETSSSSPDEFPELQIDQKW